MSPRGRGRVSLFIPCLVDQVVPEIGLATAAVLEHLGWEVAYDPRQTCCGQPAFNAGYNDAARAVASAFVSVFDGEETIVCPSGSCTAMARSFLPGLFGHTPLAESAARAGGAVLELSELLVRRGAAAEIAGSLAARVGFHNSCHSLRELGIGRGPIDLLERIEGCEVVLPPGDPVCCGFGGLFSVKFDAVAAAMASSRIDLFRELGVDLVVSNDPGCIVHLRQECSARGIDLEILHLAELLARAMGLSYASAPAAAGGPRGAR